MNQAIQPNDMTHIAEGIHEAEGSRVTLTIDGEAYTGNLDYVSYQPYRRDDILDETGELDATFELENEEVDRRGFNTGQVYIRATAEQPDEWTAPHASIWNPVVEDGEVVEDEYRVLGTVEKVEPTEK